MLNSINFSTDNYIGMPSKILSEKMDEEMEDYTLEEGMDTPGCLGYRRKLNRPLESLNTEAVKTHSDLRDVDDRGVKLETKVHR